MPPEDACKRQISPEDIKFPFQTRDGAYGHRRGGKDMTSKTTPIRTGADILIVEDSCTQAIVLKRLLEKNGYTAQVADNGIEAPV